MASRQMVGQRKPAVVVAIHAGKPDASAPDDPGSPDDSSAPDVVTCPNCACQFDETSGDVVKPGKPVQGGPAKGASYQGPDLDAADSAEPVPGKFGTARDGANGTEAMAALLAGLRGTHS